MRRIAGLGAILPTLTLSIALHQASPAQTPPAPETTYVKAGHLFDSESGTYRQNVTLVLAGDRIKSIEPGPFAIHRRSQSQPTSATTTSFPAYIDCHTHLGARADEYDPINSFTRHPLHQRLRQRTSTPAARSTPALPRSATSARTTTWTLPSAMRSTPATCPARGSSPAGPRSAPPAATVTSTACRPTSAFPKAKINGIADGPDAIRKKIRENIKYGADLIKILATRRRAVGGGVRRGAPQDSLEEMKAAVDESESCWEQARRRARPRHRGHQDGHSRRRHLHRARQLHRRRGHRPRQGPRHLTSSWTSTTTTTSSAKAKDFGFPQEATNKERARRPAPARKLPEGLQGRASRWPSAPMPASTRTATTPSSSTTWSCTA